MKQVYHEVHSAQELQALKGCKITSVSTADGDEGFCLDCADEAGNLVSFLILEDGSWHLCESKPIREEENEKCLADFKEAGGEEKTLKERIEAMEKK